MKENEGDPRKIPQNLILFMMMLHTFFSYWMLAGLYIGIFGDVVHYTAIEKRIKKEMRNWKCEKLKNGVLFLKVDIKPEKFFIDSSGFSRRKKGSWRPTKFKLKIKKKWYKLHVVCNSRGEIVAFAVTEGNVNDSVMFETLVKVLPPNSIVYGDKGYFSRKNYKIAKKYGIVLHSHQRRMQER